MVGACPFPAPQGSQVLIADTARALVSAGHKVTLLVYGYGAGEEPAGLRIVRVPRLPRVRRIRAGPSVAKPLLDALLVYALRRLVHQGTIDLIHAHNYEGLAAALAAGKRPIVYHAHNAMSDELPFYFRGSRTAAAFGALLDRSLPKRAGHIVAHHERLAAYLVHEGCDPSAVTVIPPPVDAGLFQAGPVLEDLPRVLYTGNLDAYQNIGLLLEAMATVRRTQPAARLTVATSVPNALLPGAQIVPVTSLEDLRAALEPDAVVVCPRVSWSGYPIKLLNAMAAGKAVVACKDAAYPLIHDINGVVVPSNDAEAMGAAVLRLMHHPDLRARLGRAARETVLSNHSLTKLARRLDEVYAKIVAR